MKYRPGLLRPLIALALAAILVAWPAGQALRADALDIGYLEIRSEAEPGSSLAAPAYSAHLRLTSITGDTASRVAAARSLSLALPADCGTDRQSGDLLAPGGQRFSCAARLSGREIGLAGLRAEHGGFVLRLEDAGTAFVGWLSVAEPLVRAGADPSGGAEAGSGGVALPSGRPALAYSYLRLGFEHILAGTDHVLFVIALVLLLGRALPLLKAVTAFTLAHSVTLAATTLGLVGLAPRPVEAAIALSIMFLAVEVVRAAGAQRPAPYDTLTRRWPWLAAGLFGLLHGFGFAGALAEIGLPSGDVPLALLAFNIGVEAGQILIVLVALALLVILRRLLGRMAGHAIQLAGYAIGSVSALWLIQRVVG